MLPLKSGWSCSMEFREITIQDRDWMRQLLGYSDNRAADFNFTVLYIWKDIVRSKVCRIGDYFVVRSFPKGASAPMYLFPSGRGSQEELKEVLESCMEDAHQGGRIFWSLSSPTGSLLNRSAAAMTTYILRRTLHSSGGRSSRARGILSRGSKGNRGGATSLLGRITLRSVQQGA